MNILMNALYVVQFLISIALIVVVAMQTTKSEGLTGTIGGQMTPSFKGKPGMEEQMRSYTIYISIAWFVISLLTAIVYTRTTT
ncbi:MAG TPA: preprotein translocase subunit SecG [Capsulimonadaceae bacterium]|nr:preprotein translocase subunit SecG [Capsulimonadaceae bacterium]